MAREIAIQQDDILWHFYCKRFTLAGKEITPPTNLCPYFWTAIVGVGLWLDVEVKLSKLWLSVLGGLLLWIGMTFMPFRGTFFYTVVGAVLIPWDALLMISIVISTRRLRRWLERRYPWVLPTLVAVTVIPMAIYMIVLAVTQGHIWTDFRASFWFVFRGIAYISLGVLGISILAALAALIPARRLDGLRSTVATVSAYIHAKKNKVCPPVTPPTTPPKAFTQNETAAP